MSDFELDGLLRLRSEDFQRGAQEAEDSTKELADSAEKSANRVESNFADKLENIGGRMRSVGTKMAAGITLPIAGVGFSSLQAASDAEEAEARFDEVFQNTGDGVEAFADRFADEIGRSETTIENMAANFGSMLNPMIESDEKVADLSQQFTTLTQDLASFENMDPTKVQEDLQSALAGQSETVRKYGVDLRQARIDQELMNMGIEGGTEAASRAQVAQARYNAIIDDTQSAQGNAADTADSYKNQQRALMASVKDLRIEIGEHLLPIAKDLIGVISPAVERFGELSEKQQKLIIGVAGVLAVLGPLLIIAGQLAIAISSLAPVIGFVAGILSGPLILAIGAVVGAILILKKIWSSNFLGIQQITADVLDKLAAGFEWFSDKVDESISWVMDKIAAIPEIMATVIDKIPGVDSEDIIGDLDDLEEDLFPPKPEAEAEGKAVGEAMSDGVAASSPAGLDEMAAEDKESGETVSVENVRVGNDPSTHADSSTSTTTPGAASTTASGTSGLSPSDIRAALEGMALDILSGEIEITGDNATIQDVRAELRRAGREADDRGIN